MKKLIVICTVALLFAACKEDKILLPTGLYVEEASLIMVAEGETYNNRVYTTSPFLDVSIPQDAQEWLKVKIESGYLIITSERNASIGGRSALITLKAKERSTTVKVEQNGLPTKQIPIKSATASSAQNATGNESVLASFDGDTNTFLHSQYGMTQNVFQTVYTLDASQPSIDLVYLLPRQYPDPARTPNGRFSLFGIWVKGEGTDTSLIDPSDTDNSGAVSDSDPTGGWGGLIGTVDEEGYRLVYKGNALKKGDAVNAVIVPVANPTQVKIRFAGTAANTQGGFLSLAEVAFFGKVG